MYINRQFLISIYHAVVFAALVFVKSAAVCLNTGGDCSFIPIQDSVDALLADLPDQLYQCELCGVGGIELSDLLLHELSSQHQSTLETNFIQLTGTDITGEPIPGRLTVQQFAI